MDQFDKFFKVFKALEKQNVDYILVGGVALVLHGMQRLTQDIDIFLSIVPENIEKLKNALFNVFQDDDLTTESCRARFGLYV